MRVRWAVLTALLAATTAAIGAEPGPVVLLVTLDGVRPADLGAYGADAQASPTIDALAAGGVVFARAYAPSGDVAASLDGLLGAAAAEAPPLATALSAAGAVTAAVTTNADDATHGRNRGFRDFATVPPSDDAAGGQVAFTGAERAALPMLVWMRMHRRELLTQTVLLWWHDDGAVLGRRPSPEFVRRFLPPPLDAGFDDVARRLATGEAPVAPAALAQLAGVHHAALAQFDAALALVLEQLRAPEIARRLWVIVTAPFGEALGEHGTTGHGMTLYDENVRVPLIVLPPRDQAQRRRIDAPVGLADLVPTVLAWAHVPPARPGRDLGPALRGDPIAPVDVVVTLPATAPRRVHTRAVVDAHGRKRIERIDGGVDVYDLRADPDERRPVR